MPKTNNPCLGYVYHPDRRYTEDGYKQLDIYLRQTQSHQHYDPVDVRLPVAAPTGIEYLHIRHPFHGSDHYRIGTGRIIMTDWRGKEVEAFTFGGRCAVRRNGYTLCTVTSEAPIIPLSPFSLIDLDTNHAARLAESAEALIARARAAADRRKLPFDEQLAAIAPIEMYCAVIAALEAELNTAAKYSSIERMSFLLYLHEVHHSLIATQRWITPRPFLSLE